MKLIIPALIVLLSVISSKGQVCPLKNPMQDSVHGKSNCGSGISGTPFTLTLRCKSTAIENANVVYVVDGVLLESTEISQLNPLDILSIDILKPSQQIFSCRMFYPVIIITTKKKHHRKFIIRDAKSMLAVGNATIEAKSVITGKVSYFVADAFGRFETDSLKTNDYDITISSAGYKTSKLSLKSILQNKGEIKLEPAFLELEEVVVTGQVIISCRRMNSTCYHQEKYFGSFICGAGVVAIQTQKQTPDNVSLTTTAFHVYPNPVTASGTINILFPDIKTGKYQICMLNASGQFFYSFQKQITGKGETEQIHLNGKTLPGIYIVQIMDDQKKLLQTNKIVVQ